MDTLTSRHGNDGPAESLTTYFVPTDEVLALLSPQHTTPQAMERLLLAAQLSPRFFTDSAEKIDIDSSWHILNAQYNLANEESHNLSQRPLVRGTTRLIFSNILHCTNLLEALNNIVHTYNVIHGGEFNFVRRRGKQLSLVVDDRHFHYIRKPPILAVEYALLRIHCALSFLARKPLRVQRVGTPRTTLPAYHHHLKLFDAPIELGQKTYTISYHASEFDTQLESTQHIDINGNLFPYYLALQAEHHNAAQTHAFTDRVIRLILECTAREQRCNQARVASLLNMSVPTLRRHLQHLGTSYRALQDQAHGDLALTLLQEYRSPEITAQKLGYSELRSFKRAFRRWHHMTPAAYLQQNSHRPSQTD